MKITKFDGKEELFLALFRITIFFLSPKDHHLIIFLTLLRGKHSTATQFRFLVQCNVCYDSPDYILRGGMQFNKKPPVDIWPWQYGHGDIWHKSALPHAIWQSRCQKEYLTCHPLSYMPF